MFHFFYIEKSFRLVFLYQKNIVYLCDYIVIVSVFSGYLISKKHNSLFTVVKTFGHHIFTRQTS